MCAPSQPTKPQPKGRPEKRILKMDASSIEVFQRIFKNAKQPDAAKPQKT